MTSNRSARRAAHVAAAAVVLVASACSGRPAVGGCTDAPSMRTSIQTYLDTETPVNDWSAWSSIEEYNALVAVLGDPSVLSGTAWGLPALVRLPSICQVSPSISLQRACLASPERHPVSTTNSTASLTTGVAVPARTVASATGISEGASAL